MTSASSGSGRTEVDPISWTGSRWNSFGARYCPRAHTRWTRPANGLSWDWTGLGPTESESGGPPGVDPGGGRAVPTDGRRGRGLRQTVGVMQCSPASARKALADALDRRGMTVTTHCGDGDIRALQQGEAFAEYRRRYVVVEHHLVRHFSREGRPSRWIVGIGSSVFHIRSSCTESVTLPLELLHITRAIFPE